MHCHIAAKLSVDDEMPEIVVGRDQDDMKRFGSTGTIYIGKHVVGKGEDSHTTTPVLMDVIRPHIITLCGKRGTGKSYSMGVFVEEILKLPEEIKSNLCIAVVDTQGIFWTMKTPVPTGNLIREWGMEPAGFGVNVYVPEGQAETFSKAGVPFDGTFSISPGQLSYSDWLSAFGIDMNEPMGIVLQKALSKLHDNHSLNDIIAAVRVTEGFEKERIALENMLSAARYWGIFGEKKMPHILVPGKASIIDVSLTPQSVRALLISLISRKIFEERTRARRQEEMGLMEGELYRKVPMCWLMIDEAHNFIPNDSVTAASEPLLKIVKEGRQPGISLIIASQQPYKLHPDALSQCDLVIAHRITSRGDIESLESIMQTYILFDIKKYIEELPKEMGMALIMDDNSERLYKIKIRPRQSWHAGSSPTAIYTI